MSGPGGANYRKPLSLGTDQAMYFEDNEVYIAQSAGAKALARFHAASTVRDDGGAGSLRAADRSGVGRA